MALFFHRWGKIRMLLPYQPVFKEEEPAIVGCSPSPTLQLASGQQSQLIQQTSLGGQSQQNSSAVLVSTNKFVSLDPAAIRRTQFMVSTPFTFTFVIDCSLFSKIPLYFCNYKTTKFSKFDFSSTLKSKAMIACGKVKAITLSPRDVT